MASFEAIYWALPEGISRRSRERLAALAAETFPPSTAPQECAAWCLEHPHAHDEAIRLLREVHALGAELAVQHMGTRAEHLRVRDPEKAVSEALRSELIEHQEDVITLLRFGPVAALTPGEFARSASVARFHTRSGEVLLAADNADPCHPLLREPDGLPVYRVRDLSHLPEVVALWPEARALRADCPPVTHQLDRDPFNEDQSTEERR